MVDFSNQYNGSNMMNENLAFDLRQKYAQLVGLHLEDVALARKDKNFGKYFEALEDLHTIVSHKFKAPKKLKDPSQKKGFKHLKYNELKKEFIDLANHYKAVYTGNSTEAEGYNKILMMLRRIEMFIYFKMDEANMFGSKRDIEGLI